MPTDTPSAKVLPFVLKPLSKERVAEDSPAGGGPESREKLTLEAGGVADEVTEHLHTKRLIALLHTDFPDDWYVDEDTGEGIFLAADEAMFREFFGLFGLDWNPRLPIEKLLDVWTYVCGNYSGAVRMCLQYPNMREDFEQVKTPLECRYIEVVLAGRKDEVRQLAEELGLAAMMRGGERPPLDGSGAVTIKLR